MGDENKVRIFPAVLTMWIMTWLSWFFMSGCAFYLPYREVTVQLPEPAERWKGTCVPLEYRLLYPDYASPGGIAEKTVDAEAATVKIPIPKGGYIPCLLEAISPRGRLKPAGVIVYEKGEMEFSWEDGFIAGLLLRLYHRRDVYPAMNVERLYREILDAAEGDVWSLDPHPVILGLSFGSFSSHSIRKLEEKEIVLPLPPGNWVWDNPFREVYLAPDPENDIAEPSRLSLPAGNHHLFHAESAEHVTISIAESEWHAVFWLKGSNISGHW